ncbi:hypothetical protein BGX27_000670 [Mortierella sp. AM989]|nr:hypothetical protein BGX27_000670 [Mortierella sp. AM989]
MAKTDISTPAGTGRLDSLTPDQKEFLKQMWAEIFLITDSGEAAFSTLSVGLLTPASSTNNSVNGFDGTSIQSKSSTGKKSWFSSSKPSSSTQHQHHASSDDTPSNRLGFAEIGIPADKVRDALWSDILGDHPDTLALRFLRARKWNVRNSMNMMLKAFKWRLDENIEELKEKNEDELELKYRGFKKQMEMGKSYAHGTDKQGRVVVYINVRLHKPADQDQKVMEKYTVYMMEMSRMMIKYPIETACIVFDLSGFGLSNMDYNFVKYMVQCFEAYYPESLGVLLVHKAPLVFWGIWKVIEPWLDPVVASKIRFTRSDKDLTEYIDAAHLLARFEGGKDKFTYEYIPVMPGENDHMRDEEAKERLTEEWKAIMWKFEALTREWVVCKKTKGARPEEVIEAERNQLTKEMHAAYIKLDYYIRAKTLYQRGEHPVYLPDGDTVWPYKN